MRSISKPQKKFQGSPSSLFVERTRVELNLYVLNRWATRVVLKFKSNICAGTSDCTRS